jgi:hypothetical protein
LGAKQSINRWRTWPGSTRHAKIYRVETDWINALIGITAIVVTIAWAEKARRTTPTASAAPGVTQPSTSSAEKNSSAPPRPMMRPNGLLKFSLGPVLLVAGLACACTAQSLSEPPGYADGATSFLLLGWLLCLSGAGRMLITVRTSATKTPSDQVTRDVPRTVVALSSVAVTAVLLGVSVSLTGDYATRIADCLVGTWVIDSHTLETEPPMAGGSGGELILDARGAGVLRVQAAVYRPTNGQDHPRLNATFSSAFNFEANDGTFSVIKNGAFSGSSEIERADRSRSPFPMGSLNFFHAIPSYDPADYVCVQDTLRVTYVGSIALRRKA